MKGEPRELIEGPEAWQRFQGAMRAALSVPKSAILKDEKRHARAKKKKAELHGYYIEYEGENSLCTGRAIVIAENVAEALRLTAAHQDSPDPFPIPRWTKKGCPPEVTEVDISRPSVIYNDPGL
jgi:hypothetical protein